MRRIGIIVLFLGLSVLSVSAQDISWAEQNDISFTDGGHTAISDPGPNNGWNHNAQSEESIPLVNCGEISVTVPSIGANYIIALDDFDANPVNNLDRNLANFSLHIGGSGTLVVKESGSSIDYAYQGTPNAKYTVSVGDHLRILKNNTGGVMYYVNGELLYTSAISANSDLYGEVFLNLQGWTLPNIDFRSYNDDVTWDFEVMTAINGPGTLGKATSEAYGWNSYAKSTASFPVEQGVSFSFKPEKLVGTSYVGIAAADLPTDAEYMDKENMPVRLRVWFHEGKRWVRLEEEKPSGDLLGNTIWVKAYEKITLVISGTEASFVKDGQTMQTFTLEQPLSGEYITNVNMLNGGTRFFDVQVETGGVLTQESNGWMFEPGATSEADATFRSGNVGIGVQAPFDEKLRVGGDIHATGDVETEGSFYTTSVAFGNPIANYATFAHRNHMNSTSYAIWQNQAGATTVNAKAGMPLFLGINNAAAITITADKNVGIGTVSPDAGYKLVVKGKIGAANIRIDSDTWGDYVFDEDYELRSLEETKTYIQENGHLPGVPSSEELTASGIDLHEMLEAQMVKIEELTLQLIKVNEELQVLKKGQK